MSDLVRAASCDAESRVKSPIDLLREARAVLETWKDVVPAVSLCADIDRALAASSAKSKHKKYILFLMAEYDNAGGLNAVEGSFDTLPEAQLVAGQSNYDIKEVADRDTWEIVWRASRV